MNAVTSYSLLQEFHSRPPPIPVSLINSNLHHTVYPDANATLLNLACKTAQNRRRKQGQHSHSKSIQIQGQSPSPFALLSSDQAKIQRVYSEVMMSSDSAPQSSFQPTFTSHRNASIDSSLCKRTPTLPKRVIRQRSISREESNASLSFDTIKQQRRRSKVIEQALIKSKEARQMRKPVDLSLVQKSPQAAAVHGTEDVDDEDDDWAAFIANGYSDFPRPPPHISPASTIMSGSTFLSPSTCATSLHSSDLRKSDEDWLNDELAWADSEEEDEPVIASKVDEEQEVVKSPSPYSVSSSKRVSGRVDVFSTPGPSPLMPSIQVSQEKNGSHEEEVPSALPTRKLLHQRSSSKLLRILGDGHCRPRLRQASQASSITSSHSSDLNLSSLAYLSPDSVVGKAQSTASKLRNRLASKMNLSSSRRTSTPDVPITPCSATSDVAQHHEGKSGLSPSCEIFGTAAVQSAAINARASAYAAMAASMMSPSRDSLRSSASSLPQQQMHPTNSPQDDTYLAIPKAGFCFDYDPKSPFYLSSPDDCEPVSPAFTRSPSPSSIRQGKAVPCIPEQADHFTITSVLPTLRRMGSFQMYK